MIEKKFGVDFYSYGGALTLSPECVGNNDSGWRIEGEIQEDYYRWVNEFSATHPQYGRVWGNFEDVVYADSEEGYEHFYANHEPDAWDYLDI
jgi:hypothetical protein